MIARHGGHLGSKPQTHGWLAERGSLCDRMCDGMRDSPAFGSQKADLADWEWSAWSTLFDN